MYNSQLQVKQKTFRNKNKTTTFKLAKFKISKLHNLKNIYFQHHYVKTTQTEHSKSKIEKPALFYFYYVLLCVLFYNKTQHT